MQQSLPTWHSWRCPVRRMATISTRRVSEMLFLDYNTEFVCTSQLQCTAGPSETITQATRWLSWCGVGLASADRLPVVVRTPAGPLKGNGRRPQKKNIRDDDSLEVLEHFFSSGLADVAQGSVLTEREASEK